MVLEDTSPHQAFRKEQSCKTVKNTDEKRYIRTQKTCALPPPPPPALALLLHPVVTCSFPARVVRANKNHNPRRYIPLSVPRYSLQL
jgi:hypothetical protein